MAKLVFAGQQKSASSTDAFLQRVVSQMSGKKAATLGARVDPSSLRRGTAPEDVYARPIEQYRYAESVGKPGRAAATERATLLIADDLKLAEREIARQSFQANKVTGYRRVIHPELSRSGTCGLCIAASDRVYHKSELMPLHTRCNCLPVPILGKNDPGAGLNADDLSALYKAAGGTGRQELAKVRYVVHQHGELGPVLRLADDHFTGPSSVEAKAAA